MLIRKTTETQDGGPDFCCNSGKLDRYGDIVVPAGIDLKQFSRNNIALLNHNADAPIGVWENMRVEAGELRGRLKLAPEGTSPRIDEVRKLVQAKVLKATSIGFMPIESEPLLNERGNRSGVRYLRSELIEISLVSTPADGNAVALAKSMKISNATMREVFQQQNDLTIGQRIRKARQAIQKARSWQERADTPAKRNIFAQIIASLEKEERELRSGTLDARGLKVRERAKALLQRLAREEAAREAASPRGQQRRHEAETLAKFEAQVRKHADLPEQKFKDESVVTWRGQKIDLHSTWRGKKV